MSYYSHCDIADLNDAIKGFNRLLSDEIQEIKRNKDKTYTSKDVLEILDTLYKNFESAEMSSYLDNISEEFSEFEDEISNYAESSINCGSMKDFKDIILDNLPDSASLSDRNEIEEQLNKCECIK